MRKLDSFTSRNSSDKDIIRSNLVYLLLHQSRLSGKYIRWHIENLSAHASMVEIRSGNF